MRLDVYVHHEPDPHQMALLYEIHQRLISIERKEDRIMTNIDQLTAAVADETTKEDSLITLVVSIKQELDALTAGQLPPDVQAKVDALFNTVTANSAKITAAITANTPAPTGTGTGGGTGTAPPPVVTGVAPNVGPAAGGTSVTLTGTGFQSGAHGSLVDIGGARATTNSVSADGTSMLITTGPGAVGSADVVVTNGDTQTGSLPAGYTYQ